MKNLYNNIAVKNIVIKSLISIFAISQLTLLGGCATVKEPTDVGTFGAVSVDGKKLSGRMFEVVAPWASECRADGRASYRRSENGNFRFITTPVQFVTIECKNAKGDVSNRQVAAVFDEKTWRTVRTTSTVVNAALTGGIGLLVSPVTAELTKNQYKYVPNIINMPSKQALANADIMANEREIAVNNWSLLINKSATPNSANITSIDVLNLMRDEDLKAFSPR